MNWGLLVVGIFASLGWAYLFGMVIYTLYNAWGLGKNKKSKKIKKVNK